MTTLDERYADLLEADDAQGLLRLVAELDAMRHGAPSRRADMTIRYALRAHAVERAHTPLSLRPHLGAARRAGGIRGLPARVGVAIAATVALVLGGGMYLHGPSATPVSAQTILQDAPTAGLAPNQITKFDYQVSNSANFGGSVQIWVGANTSDQPTRLGYAPQPQYDATHQEVCPTDEQCYGNVAMRFLIGSIETVVGQTSAASLTGSQVTGQQTYDGALCDVVQAPSGATFYFDAQTYVLRGAEWTDLQQGGAQHGPNSTWHAQLSAYGIVAASDAPALPFTIEMNRLNSTTGSDATSGSVTHSP
jgi:hypothetical protein